MSGPFAVAPALTLDDAFSSSRLRDEVRALIASTWSTWERRLGEPDEEPDSDDPVSGVDEEDGDAEETCTTGLIIRHDDSWSIPEKAEERFDSLILGRTVQSTLSRSRALRRIIEQRVMSRLSAPRIVHAADVHDAIVFGPGSDPTGNGDAGWNAAARFLQLRLSNWRPGCPAYNPTKSMTRISLPFFLPLAPGTMLVHLGNGIWVSVLESGDAGRRSHLSLTVSGWCTPRAAVVVARDFVRPFSALLQIFAMRGTQLGLQQSQSALRELLAHPQSAQVFNLPDIRNAALLDCVNRSFETFRLVLARGSSAMVYDPQRVLTALRLLSEISHQRAPALKVAMSFAAIEAMLGTDKESISEQVARRAATLLCPNANGRQRAAKAVKVLYGDRSRVLHGKSVDVASTAVGRAEQLARATLLAILDWDEAARQLGTKSIKGQDLFFQQIQDADYSGKTLIAIPEDILAMAATVFSTESPNR